MIDWNVTKEDAVKIHKASKRAAMMLAVSFAILTAKQLNSEAVFYHVAPTLPDESIRTKPALVRVAR